MSVTGRSSLGVRGWEWVFVVALLLLAWGLRLCFLAEVPPGWRDDELINIHALSSQLLEAQFPLYFLGASGHEPLYHYLHAGIHAVLGFNVLSGHILSVAFGLLSVALTYSLVRRLFPARAATAATAALALAVSFWSLVYSRMAIRHISLPPLAVGALYAFWRQIDASGSTQATSSSQSGRSGLWTWGLTGLLLGATLYTYTASRLLPILLAIFAAYLALVHRDLFARHWRGMVVTFAVMTMVAVPLGLAIVEGRTKRAVEGIGADARVAELAEPLRALREGNLRPLLKNTWGTLGMFHATGDPEWLYNIPARPVFDLLGGVLLWGGVGLCLGNWRRPRYFFLILWLGLGLLPAFVSVPAASLSHTILSQPVAYILPAVSISWIRGQGSPPGRRSNTDKGERPRPSSQLRSALRRIAKPPWTQAQKHRTYPVANLASLVGCLVAALFLTTNAVRDLRDYFIVWPRRGMVRLLYRSDYREAAQVLDGEPALSEVALGSALMGPWDRLALGVDIQREDVAVRLFNPERAVVCAAGASASSIILTSWPDPAPLVGQILEMEGDGKPLSGRLTIYRLPTCDRWQSPLCDPRPAIDSAEFDNGLMLTNACWLNAENLGPGKEATVLTTWRVAAPLDLPPIPVIANPPPPMVYSGPRLAVFAHLLDADGVPIVTDDGLWVDPLTLQTGDHFVQLHRFPFPTDAPEGPYDLSLGLYDPKTGERRKILDSLGRPRTDQLLLPGWGS